MTNNVMMMSEDKGGEERGGRRARIMMYRQCDVNRAQGEQSEQGEQGRQDAAQDKAARVARAPDAELGRRGTPAPRRHRSLDGSHLRRGSHTAGQQLPGTCELPFEVNRRSSEWMPFEVNGIA